MSGRGECRDLDWASRIICRIGKAAGVKVDIRRARRSKGDPPKATGKVNDKPKMKVKFASAHDLRRSFGSRWAIRVMPVVLQQLMLHGSIDTTLRYHVGQDAEATADAIWAAHATLAVFSGRESVNLLLVGLLRQATRMSG